jgi:hypothetical protein
MAQVGVSRVRTETKNVLKKSNRSYFVDDTSSGKQTKNWLYSVDDTSRGKQSKDRDIWFTRKQK